MHIFYTTNIQGNTGILDETESHHCIKVLRLKPGDRINMVDGKGGFFEGVIAIPDSRACSVEIVKSDFEHGMRNYHLHIAIAPTKNIDRFEWFLEKATEIGIDEISPIICQRSERKVLREDRLEKVISSAMKQSLKAYHPVLHPAVSFTKFIEKQKEGNKLIAHCIEEEKLDLLRFKPQGSRFTLLIGPEGDFSPEEVKQAIIKGFIAVSLGKSRLRTETAGIASCQIITDLMELL